MVGIVELWNSKPKKRLGIFSQQRARPSGAGRKDTTMATEKKLTRRQQAWLKASDEEAQKGSPLAGFFVLLAMPNEAEGGPQS